MALIEGVGDEVTVLFGLLLVFLLLMLAWFSTHTVEQGDSVRAASPSLVPGQPGGDGPNAQAAGVRSITEEEPPGGAASDQLGSAPGDLRLRTNRERPLPSTGGPSPESSPADNTITLRLKFLNDTERLARVHPDDTVGALKRAHFPGQEPRVRLIYQGQLLRDDSQTLAALHLAHHSVVHCHLLPRPAAAPPARGAPPLAAPGLASAHAALHVGGLMVPLFALLLGTLWYLQLQYRHVFTATATAGLAGLTLLFGCVAFAVYRR